MGLLIHVRSHPDELVGELSGLLASPLDDPFATELVSAPTRGIERWLTQRIASELGDRTAGDGVCANVEFPSPRRLVREVLVAAPEPAASVEAWEGAALTRSVVAVLDSHLDESWMWLLARYIDAPGALTALGNSQRLRAALKIAGLFMRYGRRRPEMVRAWHAGDDIGPDGRLLPTTDRWQPGLWRLLRAAIGVPSLAELLPDALEPIREGSVDLDLPSRLSVYGLTAADPMDIEVLEAVAARREVHLYLLHPSPALWHETARRLDRSLVHPTPLPRAGDPTRRLARHPLLRSWAQESRELQLVLADRGLTAGAVERERVRPTLLSLLQHEIRTNEVPGPVEESSGRVTEGEDRSIQIHVSHGARRQVEVLRDAILHVLAADATLEPRDVVVMTSDLTTFAPLLEAAFPRRIDGPRSESGIAPGDDRDGLPDLRVRIADLAPTATNPLVRFAAKVLDLAGSRLEAGTVRELVTLPAVRQCFGFDSDTADEIKAVIDDINVRWGFDVDHRNQWDAGHEDSHTWRRALDRALAGTFYADSSVRTLATIAPLHGVEGQGVRPVGLLAQILDRIVAVRDLLGRPRPYSNWGPAIATAVRLLAAPAWDEQWQWGQLERLLEQSFPQPEDPVADPDLSPDEARLLVDVWSQDVPGPLHFRTGDITVCRLVPMRSVPYRVVCLLGMDDERFPRSSRDDGDDLLLDHEIVGDADRDSEDRQLLLEALMAAGDHLIVTYAGHDELTNAAYPPAAPIAELADTLREMVGEGGMRRIVTRHPLQPFSEANFVAGRLGVRGPWGFDPMQFRGAVAVQQRAGGKGRARVHLAPGVIPPKIRLDDLTRFLEHPAKQFIRARLGFRIPAAGEISDDIVPAQLDALEEWKVTDRLLTGLLDGYSLESLAAHERGTDAVPPGYLGHAGLERAKQRAMDLWVAAQRLGYDPERHVHVTGALHVGDRIVEGSIAADRFEARIDLVTPSRLKGKQRLRAFVRLVFLTALDPDRPWHALLLGRRAKGDALMTVTIEKLGAKPQERSDRANTVLEALVGLYVEGLTQPIPLPGETAYAWQRNLGRGRDAAFKAARTVWETDRFAPEGRDPAYDLLFSDLAGMSALVNSAFPRYAEQLWSPILPLLREKSA